MKAHVDPRAIAHNGKTFHIVPRTMKVEKDLRKIEKNEEGLLYAYEMHMAVLKLLLQEGEFEASYPVEDEIDLDDMGALYFAVLEKYQEPLRTEANKVKDKKFEEQNKKLNTVLSQATRVKQTVEQVNEMSEAGAHNGALD